MPYLYQNLKRGTYGFHFKGSHQQRVIGTHFLGWEKRTNQLYYWNGLKRSEKDIVVFQYTLAGRGEIIIDNDMYELKQGDAFFIKIPSNHKYYLPKNSDSWEFIYITLFGEESLKSYEEIKKSLGQIISLDLHSAPVSMLFEMFNKVSNQKINDAYESSALAFSFLMELHRFALNLHKNKDWPTPITKAIAFIDSNYASSISLDDIVSVSGLSKYYFMRLFHKATKLTPIQYLKKTRINRSIEMLKNETLNIQDIAIRVGFSNGNYFSKVFRSYLGVSPSQFRKSDMFHSIDYLISDF
ncbi:MAG TPA: AraC family transcriptional regulator [Bacillota bacterium]|nr:AraC family transcriptional regulator [Bacillota bacterium]